MRAAQRCSSWPSPLNGALLLFTVLLLLQSRNKNIAFWPRLNIAELVWATLRKKCLPRLSTILSSKYTVPWMWAYKHQLPHPTTHFLSSLVSLKILANQLGHTASDLQEKAITLPKIKTLTAQEEYSAALLPDNLSFNTNSYFKITVRKEL